MVEHAPVDVAEPVTRLLAKARALREGRDAWYREIGPTLAALRAAKVSWQEVRAVTGISRASIYRWSGTTRSSTPTRTR